MQLPDTIKYSVRIELKSGLHIGGANASIEIGGIDSPVLVDAGGYPYIPGSSLKGKLRSLYEAHSNKIDRAGEVHKFRGEECTQCDICRAFGVSKIITVRDLENEKQLSDGRGGDEKLTDEEKQNIRTEWKAREESAQKARPQIGPTRMLVRDLFLEEEVTDAQTLSSRAQFDGLRNSLDSPLERKMEVSINRQTGEAGGGALRPLERVPAGLVFAGEIIFRVLFDGDENIAEALFENGDGGALKRLLDNDYLGGSGSRGSGHVKITFTREGAGAKKG
jgi:CRISPR-associated protein Csm3